MRCLLNLKGGQSNHSQLKCKQTIHYFEEPMNVIPPHLRLGTPVANHLLEGTGRLLMSNLGTGAPGYLCRWRNDSGPGTSASRLTCPPAQGGRVQRYSLLITAPRSDGKTILSKRLGLLVRVLKSTSSFFFLINDFYFFHYNRLTVFCQFLLYSKMTQSHTHTHTHIHTFFFSHFPPSCSIISD